MALIWMMSSLPSNQFVELPASDVDHFMKESLHLIEFGILYMLFVVAVLSTGRELTPRLNMVLALISILYGLTDEIHQSFYPYRSSTLIDFVKDTIGVSVGYFFVSRALFRGKFVRLQKVLELFKA
ncbi:MULTISPECIES: VanZ family protein [unclassified Bacillus (in: firmicutes)]|uniref:VanZ family protein n=1 Tax=unclassified Bacillus (in: firmicutes) TaxID=185979 RepID=UPI0020C89299|nr:MULTISPECIES: VanZ family protein [unclassified Bacillus (in: firmicutes)]